MWSRRALLTCALVVAACSVALASTQTVVTKPLVANAVKHAGGALNATSSLAGNIASLWKSTSNDLMSKEERLAALKAENQWKNRLILQVLPDSWVEPMPSIVQSWLRCWLACQAIYFGVGAAWAYYCYICFGDRLYKPGTIPTAPALFEQMKVAFFAMPLYAMLPAITEYIIEQGWTLAYPHVSDVGLPKYILYFVLYMTSIEFFVYWQHRLLHDIRIGYDKLHYIHHKYNKEHTMSPFAGLAFHPFDGILQALPYTWTLFYVPMHQLTHELLLFATALWTTNIHDNLHGKVYPIMGAGYHTIHHTTYKHNYGHYFVYFDKLFGTLITPEDYEKEQEAAKSLSSEESVKAK